MTGWPARGVRHRRIRAGQVAAASLAGLVLAAAGPGPASTRQVTAATTLTFSTPTIVDPFRQGFEPNISVDPTSGAIYSSVPNGTPGTSTLWRSDDGGHDWRLVEGNLQGEPSTCPPIAGGDTELAVDPVDGTLFYSDLQPLTNFNASVSHDRGKTFTCNPLSVPDTGVDRQWYAIDSNGGTSAVTGGGGGRMYFDYDDTTQSPSPAGGSVLVVNATSTGLVFGSTCTNTTCAGPSTRVTLNEGLPGNLAVDDSAASPYQHTVYALHSSANLGSVILTRCRGADSGKPASASDAATYCLDPTAATGTAATSTHWSDHTVINTDVAGKEAQIVSNNFTTLAIDTAGNLYALWSQYPGSVDTTNPVAGVYSYTGTGKLLLSMSTNGGDTWSAPQQINPPSLPNNTQPWLTAGSSGRVAIAWYGAPQAQGPDKSFGPNGLSNGVWDVYVAENLDAINNGPWSVVKVSDHPAKLGAVSTEGLVLPSGPDRSLGDFMKITHDANGALQLVYVDDNTSLNPGFQDSGPVVTVHQTGGTGLLAGRTVPQVPDIRASGFAIDPTGDARVALAGQDLTAPAHLDITSSSLTMADATHLTVTLTVAEPQLQANLGPDTTLGGATADAWLVRWDFAPSTLPSSTVPGSFFVAMENSQTGGQTFYDGAILTNGLNPATPTLYTFAYPSDHTVTGKVSGNTITWTVPTADVGTPRAGGTLYQVQAFTVTQAFPNQTQTTDPIGLFNTGGSIIAPNLADQSPSYDAPLFLSSSSTGTTSSSGGTGTTTGLSNTGAASGRAAAAGAGAVVALLGVTVLARRRRRAG